MICADMMTIVQKACIGARLNDFDRIDDLKIVFAAIDGFHPDSIVVETSLRKTSGGTLTYFANPIKNVAVANISSSSI